MWNKQTITMEKQQQQTRTPNQPEKMLRNKTSITVTWETRYKEKREIRSFLSPFLYLKRVQG
jgi:hypothetical protein